MSIAGGLPLAVDRARLHGCDALQIFSKSSSQWRARPLPPDEIAAFRLRVAVSGIAPVVAHASYLINLATSDPRLRDRSIASLGEELDRADVLGLMGVVVHPGCATGGPEAGAVRLVAQAVGEVLRARPDGRTMVLLEHTAGQGTSVGWRFEQLAAMLEQVDGHPRVGVCLDTCHLFAAGYDLSTARGYASTFEGFERLVGLDRLRAIHVNDSKKPLGSRVDRHDHIGHGLIGLDAFRRLLGDQRFDDLPMLLETPKTEGRRATSVELDPLDVANLKTLRALIPRTPRPGSAKRAHRTSTHRA